MTPTATIPGILVDLSSNNGHPIDYAAAKAGGVIAAMVKATDGLHYVNPNYETDVSGFAAVGVPTLAYHFAEFTNPPEAEAAHFLQVAGARARILDSETNADITWQNDFLVALNEPGNEELDYGSASTLPRSGIRSMLWPASYGKSPGFGDVWQFTDTQAVPGIPGVVDASVWIGPPADFDALFDVTPSPTPGPFPTPEDTTMISEMVEYRPGQQDVFQTILGGLVHYWWFEGKNDHEVLIGPNPGNTLPLQDTVPDQTPQVSVSGGVCAVTIESSAGHPLTFFQGVSGGWNARDWLN